MKLEIELVPKTSWCANLRDALTRSEWDKLRRDAYARAGSACEICGCKGKRHPVEAHEVWHYDDKNLKQTLTGITALCPVCHRVKHAGRTIVVEGKEDLVIRKLMEVNGWTREQSEEHIMKAFRLHDYRSNFDWTVDISHAHEKLRRIKENQE